jgi:hypothetical protein
MTGPTTSHDLITTSRRDFLKTSTAAVVGGAVAGPLFIPSVAMSGGLGALPAEDDTNAAPHYRKAFALLPKLSQAEEAILNNVLTVPLDRTARRLLRRSGPALEEWKRGTALPRCNWERDWQKEKQKDQLFPDMMRQKQVTDLICLRARVAYEQGRGKEAAADLAALMVMARHIGRNGPFMERILQFAFEISAIKVASAYLPRQNAETVRDLAAQLDRLPDPGTLQETMRHEKEFLLGWYRPPSEKIDRDKAYKLLRETLTEEQTQAVVKAAGSEVAALLKLIDEAAKQYDELSKILLLPINQFPVALAAFRKKHEATNSMATSILPQLENLYYAALRMQALFAMLRTAVAMALEGPERRKAFKDPFGDGPFLYESFEGGFELRSQLRADNGRKPAVLTVGVRKEK